MRCSQNLRCPFSVPRLCDMIEPVRSILKLPHKITVSKLQRDYSQDDWSKSKKKLF